MHDRRTRWVKTGRASVWWEKFLNNEFMDCDCLKNFRMSKTSFEKLVNILRPYIETSYTNEKTNIKRVSNCFFLVLHHWRSPLS